MTAELPAKLAAKLTESDLKIWDWRWYHNFSPLGLPAGTQHEIHLGHQLEKQGDIFRQIRDAFARMKTPGNGLNITSTDGLFGLYALTKGAKHVDIFMVSPQAENCELWHLDQTRIAAKLLNLSDRCLIGVREVEQIDGPYDFGIVIGALYNLPDPAQVLAKLREIVLGPLVIHEHTRMLAPYEIRFKDVRMGQIERELRFNRDNLTKDEIVALQQEFNELKASRSLKYYE